jgi:nucleoside-diphosphate-sugar epimerase
MRFYITGGAGFIGRHLKKKLISRGHSILSDADLISDGMITLSKTGEVCVHRNSEETWSKSFKKYKVDVVVHNAAVVGTDVVALNPGEATLSNVQGTHNIVRAANVANTGVCYMGTTVIYDTPSYQNTQIVEDSSRKPLTYYGIQKLAGEQIVTGMSNKCSVVRPLFAFGDEGDMNSLIAKSIYASLQNKEAVDIFLDPTKIKDYLHVSDYCEAVCMICENSNGWGTDWNVSAETPHTAEEIIRLVSRTVGKNVEKIVRWYPKTDYLGNHRLSSAKVRNKIGWLPKLDLEEGIKATHAWILDNSSKSYNPLKYLDEAAVKKIDLLQHFPVINNN